MRLVVLLLVASALIPASAAQAGQVKISASLLVKEHSYSSPCAQCGPNGTPTEFPSCDFTVFAQVPEIPGAISYTVLMKDNYYGDHRDRTATGPPFNDTDIPPYKAPAGVHWFGLSGVGGAGACEGEAGELGRYTIVGAFATVDDKTRIVGTLTAADGKPAAKQRVSIAGPTRATVTTGASGAYAQLVKKGSYKVTAPDGFCAEGAKTCTNVKTVKVSGTASANFARRKVMLSGRVDKVVCAGGCTEAFDGVTITAKGDAGSQTAVTQDGGKWSLEVPTGKWNVTASSPGREFEPPSDDVTAQGDVGGINFTTCAYDPTAGARRGARAAMRQGGGQCDPDAIDWKSLKAPFNDNTQATFDKTRGLPGNTSLYPALWKVQLFFTKGDAKFKCGKGTAWRWVVKPEKKDAVVKGKPGVGCGGTLAVDDLGKYTVTAVKQTLVKGKWVDQKNPTKVTSTVEVKDLLFVGLGDSNGSGEGNPSFYLDRCNRSVVSYQYVTAERVEVLDDRSSVTLIHASCSGASIQDLVNWSYRGVNPVDPPLPPQIEQVNEVLKNRPEGVARRNVDAVLLSAGVSNLEFGAVMKFCTTLGAVQFASWKAGAPGDKTPCEDRRVKPIASKVLPLRKEERVDDYIEGNGKTVERRVLDGLASLGPLYAKLDAKLSASIAAGGLDVRGSRVFAASYPDFSRDSDQSTCDTSPFTDNLAFSAPRFPESTWAWLGGAGDALNSRVASVGGAGWTTVPTSPSFRFHGYCNFFDPYFRGLTQAAIRGNLPGAFHPNAAGHRLEAEWTLSEVCKRLFGNPACESKPPK